MPKLRAVNTKMDHPLEIAKRRIAEYRCRPFAWKITPEEYAGVEAATIREQRVNWDLVHEFRRRKRWGT